MMTDEQQTFSIFMYFITYKNLFCNKGTEDKILDSSRIP